LSESIRSGTTPSPEAPPPIERSVRTGILWKFAGQAGAQSTRFLTVVILARLLDPSDYGTAAIAVVLASFAPTVGDMGMGSALVQTDRATRVVRSTVFWGSLAFGASISLLFVLLAPPLGRFLDDPRIGTIVGVGGLTFLIYSLGSTSQALFMRAMKFRALELRYLAALVLAGVLAIGGAAAGLGPWALVIQQVALTVTFVALLWWRAESYPSMTFSRPTFRPLFAFAVRVAGARWARLLELLVLSILIGRFVGIPDLGTWSFSMSTVILPLTVITIPIAEVLFAAFSRLQGDRDRIAALWLDSIGLLAAAVLPLLTGLAVVAPDLIPLVFGDQWEVAVPVIQILSIYVIIRCLQSWNAVVLDAVGKPQITLWTQIAALCLTPVAVVVGAEWSIEGVAVCFVVSQLVAVEIPLFVLVLSELRVMPGTVASRLAGIAGATLLMAAVCWPARLGLDAAGVGQAGRAILTIALGLLIYGAALSFLAPDVRRRVARLGAAGFRRVRGPG
jgi:O-antigen/teichoic acid export membrane protein